MAPASLSGSMGAKGEEATTTLDPRALMPQGAIACRETSRGQAATCICSSNATR